MGWHRSQEYASVVQCLLHHQAQRDGHGIVDLPLHHRGARGADIGIVQRWARGDVCVHSAASPGEGVVTGRPTLQRQGPTSEAAFVLVADWAAGLGPIPDPQARAAVEAGIS